MKSYDWTIRYEPGAISRTIMWNNKEVALVNPVGDFDEETEGNLAAGLAFAARMHRVLKMVSNEKGILSTDTLKEVNDTLNGVKMIDVGTYIEVEDTSINEYWNMS